MKNIGIVRRLDELGRIVIPREFRKSHRINVGDPLEISATENGSIIIHKVDYTSDLAQLCDTVCSSLSGELNVTVAASNFERILASCGHGKQALIERELTPNVIKMLKNRNFYNGSIVNDEIGRFPEIGFNYICITPILSYDDCFGGLMAFSQNPVGGIDIASLRLAGRLIGDTLQKF